MKKLVLFLIFVISVYGLNAQKRISYMESVIIDGELKKVEAYFEFGSDNRYVKVNGVYKDFYEVYPRYGKGYAKNQPWYENDENILVRGRYYEKISLPERITAGDMEYEGIEKFAVYKGVGVYGYTGYSETPDRIYIPVESRGIFQAYVIMKEEPKKITYQDECVIVNGSLAIVQTSFDYSSNTKYVNVNGSKRKFDEVYPAAGKDYAASAAWYVNKEAIEYKGKKYKKYMMPKILSITEITRAGVHKGVGIYKKSGDDKEEIIYVPVRPGCEFQPYKIDDCGEAEIVTSKESVKAGELIILTAVVKSDKKGYLAYMWDTNGTKISGGESNKVTISTKGLKNGLQVKLWVDNYDAGCEYTKEVTIPVRN